MTDIDLIGFPFFGEGDRRKYGQFTEVDHYLAIAEGTRAAARPARALSDPRR